MPMDPLIPPQRVGLVAYVVGLPRFQLVVFISVQKKKTQYTWFYAGGGRGYFQCIIFAFKISQHFRIRVDIGDTPIFKTRISVNIGDKTIYQPVNDDTECPTSCFRING